MTWRCPDCGRPTHCAPTHQGRPSDAAMGVYTRTLECPNGHRHITAEIAIGQLSELRRLAFLYRLSESRREVPEHARAPAHE